MERNKFIELGIRLHGSRRGWQAGLARRLSEVTGGRYSRQRIHDWSAGTVPVPRTVGALLEMMAAAMSPSQPNQIQKEIDDMPKRSTTAAVIAAILLGAGLATTTLIGDAPAQSLPVEKGVVPGSVLVYSISELIALPPDARSCKFNVAVRIERVERGDTGWRAIKDGGPGAVASGTGGGQGATAVATSSDVPADAPRPVFVTNSQGLITLGFDPMLPANYALVVLASMYPGQAKCPPTLLPPGISGAYRTFSTGPNSPETKL